MDRSSYCDILEKRLSGWKALLHDILQRSAGAPGSKTKHAPLFPAAELHAVINEINAQLEDLESACPSDWYSGRWSGGNGMRDLKITLKKFSEEAPDSLIPDSLSWVSG
jgi:hypothetical protein